MLETEEITASKPAHVPVRPLLAPALALVAALLLGSAMHIHFSDVITQIFSRSGK